MDEANEAIAQVDGVPDGLSLADWAEANDVGKTTSYALVKILKAVGIEPKFVRKKGAAKPSPFLEGKSLAAINHLLMQHRDGKSIAQLEVENTAAMVLIGSSTPTPQATNTSNPFDPSQLLKRLQAADLAISTGLPLTRQEVFWIIGMSENSRLPATRIRIGRTSLSKWTLLAPTSENLIPVAYVP